MLDALIHTLAAQRYETTLGISSYDPEHEETWLAAMLSRRPDGIVLTGTEHTARTRRLLVNADVPVVELWDYQPHPLDMVVGFSQEDAGRAAFRHLAADRKSTRLNSSHSQISYAVFCLKKKK